jgi:hypothetical protein
LRIVEHRILPVDLVLALEIIGVGSSPVAIQGGSCLSITHGRSP